jgi:hypothetical protein
MKCAHLVSLRCTHAESVAFRTVPHPSVCGSCAHYEGPDRGLGDTVHRVASATGVTRVVKAVERMTGVPCGCPERRNRLNGLVPFGGGDVESTVYEEGDAGDEHG